MGKKKGKKSGGQTEEQATGGQSKKPEKASGDQPSKQAQPKEHPQAVVSSEGDAGPSRPLQKKKKQQPPPSQPEPPPSQPQPLQVTTGGVSESGSQQQQKKKKQKQQQQPPQQLQQPAATISGDIGPSRGIGRAQPDGGQIGPPPQQAQAARQLPPQTPQAWGQKRGPSGTPPPRFPGPSPPQEKASPEPGMTGPPVVRPPGMVGPRGTTPPKVVSTGAVPQSAVDTSGVGAITKGLQTLRIPSRKDRNKCGTRGRRITVETNHLALDLSRIRNNIVTHYDVAIDPFVPKRLLRPAMEEFRRKHYPQRFPAFDGRKNLYSSGELPFGGEIYDEVEVRDEETCREKQFKITIKFASQVDLLSLKRYMTNGSSLVPPQEAIQAVDIVLRNAPAFRFVQVGRSFFTPPKDQVVQLGDGLEMWYGFFQSAILGWKPFVNIDVAHKGFPTPKNVVKIVMEICNLREDDLQREMTVWQRADFMGYIRGLKIDYMLPKLPTSKRTYKVNNIVKSAAEQKFELDDGRSITVEEYFSREKRIRLSFPRLPCLHVGSLNRPKPIYVPAELCTVTKGQVVNRKMNETQTSNMIKLAATNTDDRKRKIHEAHRVEVAVADISENIAVHLQGKEDGDCYVLRNVGNCDFYTLKLVGFNEDPCVKEFGLSVSDRFEKVEARVLDAPQLEYNIQVNKRNIVQPIKGVWRPTTFVSSNKLTSWIVLCLNKFTNEGDLRRFAAEMQNMGRSLGMDIGPPLPPVSMAPPTRSTRDLMDFFTSMKNKVQLVVVVVPDRGDAYAKVKQVAELNVGVLTQCLKGRTMSRMNGATCSNILLKVNSKLNGINHTLASVSRPPCLRRPIMIVGADVTHPSPDQIDIPSVAAVSASHDPKAFQYNIQIRLQPPRVEIIEDLEAIMKQQLLFFYKRTKFKPERIIFFRDGVSEGQFSQVMKNEVNAIRRACSSLEPGYKPKVTFLVVQKRHHTRFFPRSEDADGRNKNVPPGTVVDTEITHPTEVDFYLVSHASIQGVSRPTKYRLLWNDDENMTEDEIEEITYYLCHMFSRCTRSVSYPAPTYYAHLAAYRARVYLEGEKVKLSDLPNEQKRCAVMTEIISDHPMFFV